MKSFTRAAGTGGPLPRMRRAGIPGVLLTFASLAAPAHAVSPGETSVPVTFQNGKVALAGTLHLPAGRGPHPAVVVFHAASGGTRDFHAYQHLVTALPSAGFAVLIYDRRGSGASGGDFSTATFEDLARDGISGIALLKSRRDIDPARIGVWGVSQGGWLGPLAATLSRDVAFVVSVSGPGVSPAKQMDYAAAYALRAAGHPPEVVERALRVRAAVNDYYRGRATRRDAEQAVAGIRSEGWFGQVFLPGSGNLPADPRHTKWRAEMDYEPLDATARVRVPIAFFFAPADRWVPVEESIANLRKAVHLNPAATFWTIPDADHLMQTGAPDTGGPISEDYLKPLLEWLRRWGNPDAGMNATMPTENQIVLTRSFGARRERVFEALTRAELITRWMKPSAMTLVGCEFDLKVGGTLLYVFRRPSGRTIEVRGVFEAVRAPSRFVYVETYDFSPLRIHVTTDLETVGDDTLLTQTLVYASKAERDADFKGVAESSAEIFANLERFLAAGGP